ncbi:MAG TPA: hypothetical protein VL172_21710, partial [Kofleriaceae bacterium]|nr:hypothetical protein [Kofleriaceae bacterium]
RSDGFSFDQTAMVTATLGSGSASRSLPVPGFGDAQVVRSQLYIGSPIDVQVWKELQPPSTEYGLIVGSTLLPWISQEAFEPTTGRITWTQSGTGTPDGVVAGTSYQRTTASGTQIYNWRVLAPPGTLQVQLPDLPTDLAALAPQPGDTATADVTLVERSDYPAYATMRRRGDPDTRDSSTLWQSATAVHYSGTRATSW